MILLALLFAMQLGNSPQLRHVEIQPAPQQPAAQQPAAQAEPKEKPKPGSISGQVFNAATGEPLKKAEVVIYRADPSPNTPFRTNYGTVTGADGKFATKDIEPGKYRVTVRRTGFVMGEYGSRGYGRPGTTLTLGPGQELKDVTVRLTPQGVVSGRVLDEDGEPVAYAQIQLMRYRYTPTGKQLMPMGGGSTNDLGEYRAFSLPPGRYYMSATYRGDYQMVLDRSANPGMEQGYVPVWYPGTTDRSGAAMIEVQPGAHVRGVDFTMAKVRTVQIRGRVVTEPGIRGPRTMVFLNAKDSGTYGPMSAPAPVDPQGNFVIRGVGPGAYTLNATVADGSNQYGARQEIDVGHTDLENVVLTVSRGMDIPGQVKFEGASTPPTADMRVFLRAREQSAMMFARQPTGAVEENGSFTLKGTLPGQYEVSVFGLPDGYYVKSVRTAQQDAPDWMVDLTRGPAELTVTVSPGAATVSGLVQNDKDQPAAAATVVLVPDAKHRERMQAFKTATTDQYGRYNFKNLDPGEYKLFAWEDVESGAWWDPEFLKPVESKGKSVTLRENSRESADLDLIPAEAQPPRQP